MELLFWTLLGAAIGVYAAQKKGFSKVGGVIGGMMLGPFAFLLFFVSGIVSSDEQQRKCPFCAEWIRPEATVCKHCHKEVPPLTTPAAHRGMSLILKYAVVVLAIFLGLIVYVVISNPGSSSSRSSSAGLFTALEPTVTMAEFSSLKSAMTYEDAVKIIGVPGQEISRSDIAGYTTVMYAWKNPNGSNMNAMFQNGGLVNKEFGLE